MLQDFTLHQPISSWFFNLIEYVKIWFVKGKNRNGENYFLIN
jgi:hypothetical protein